MFQFPQAQGAEASEERYLHERGGWLVRIRWLVLASAALLVAGAAARGVATAPSQLIMVLVGLCLHNALQGALWRRGAFRGLRRIQLAIAMQLCGDVLGLALLLHYSDAVENPYATLYVLPVTLGAALLDGRTARFITLFACALHTGFVLAEHTGVLGHHPIVLGPHRGVAPLERDEVHESILFVVAHVSSVWTMLLATHYLVRSVVARRLRAEALQRQHERIAASRAQLAHVGEISAGVAHAVRNPLHGVMNCVELLEPHLRANPEAQETLGLLGEGLKRIEGVTQRLLLLIRDSPMCRRPTDVDDLVRDCLKFIPGRARGRTVHIRTEFAGVGEAMVDADRLVEAVANVLDNAVDAVGDGGTISVRTASLPDGWVAIGIEDNGAGMPEEELAKVFHPFFTTKPIGQGTGLGLAIAKRVMEQHEGHIRVESAPERGTMVEFTFPRDVRGAAEEPQS